MGCLMSTDVYPMVVRGDAPLQSVGMNGLKGSPSSLTSAVKLDKEQPSSSNRLTVDQLKKAIKIPLTEREVFSVCKSWKSINRNMTSTGIAMFLRMFETRSDVKAMFEQFRSVDKADLGSSRALENHALLVMNALDEAITNMDDPDYMIDLLLTTGKSHTRFEHFSTVIFWAIEEPFLRAVKGVLGDRFTSSVETIYRKTIKFILQTLTTGFENSSAIDSS